MKEEHVKNIRNSAIAPPSVAGNTEHESDFQRINWKAIKYWFKIKNSPTDQSKISRTMLGVHWNEDKMTRSLEEELRKTFVDEDFEFGSRRSYGSREKKDDPFVTFSSDRAQ